MKERKQITGTTAQINAYEGHEGQIVWDKEKKTFVGMSGTAGKNYPLASQAYVDTQFLPLTGGELTGEVGVKGGDGRGAIYQKDSGASIFLFAPHHSTYKGGFIIRARGTGGSELDLKGSGDGTLSWFGGDVDVIETQGSSYIRYRSGLQICWGLHEAKFDLVPWGPLYEAVVDNLITFPVPFMGNPIVTTTTNNSYTPQQGVLVTSTGISRIWFWHVLGVQNRVALIGYIAIGRWK